MAMSNNQYLLRGTAIALVIGCLSASPAAAHRYHRGHHYAYHHSYRHIAPRYTTYQFPPFAWSRRDDWRADSSRPADCYGIAWCGCYLRHVLGIADKSFNAAIRWLHWGRPVSGPQVGAVAVAPHHVALIKGEPDASGRWLIQDGNDGPVRVHRRSLSFARWFRVAG